jgi:hypothetical protein
LVLGLKPLRSSRSLAAWRSTASFFDPGENFFHHGTQLFEESRAGGDRFALGFRCLAYHVFERIGQRYVRILAYVVRIEQSATKDERRRIESWCFALTHPARRVFRRKATSDPMSNDPNSTRNVAFHAEPPDDTSLILN